MNNIKNITLNERKRHILEAVIKDYLHSAEPVGSRTIWRKYMSDISPATIRNEMSDLEDLGLITQPHTSAGRIPTDKGFRYYVNHIMKNRQPTPREEEIISKIFSEIHKDIEETLHRTLKVLSQLLEYASLVATIGEKIRVYSMGISHIFKQPEFSDLNYARHLVETLEEEDFLAEMMREYTSEEKVSIHIGSENKFKEIKNCGVVTSSYPIGNFAKGGLAVIGPIRMHYAKVTGILEAISARLEKIMEG